MDKVQKQLINTYFRKRNLAAKEHNIYKFKVYEMSFGIKHKLIEPNNLSNRHRAIHYNALWNTDYQYIKKFGQYGGDIALAGDKKNNDIFINKKGEPDVSRINPDEINDNSIRATYYNALWNTNYSFILEFDQWGYDLAIAYIQDNPLFINKNGEPDISGIDDEYKNDDFVGHTIKNTKELIDKQNK